MALNAEHSDVPDGARDPVLDRLYAEGALEQPPATLNDAIRAAARREVGAAPRRLGALLRAWRTPVSIAAVLILSASLVMLMREEVTDPIYYGPPSTVPSPEGATDAQSADAPRPQAAPASRAEPKQRVETPPPQAASRDRRGAGRERERAPEPVQDDRARQAESMLSRVEPSPVPSTGAGKEGRPAAPAVAAARRSPSQDNAAAATEADSGTGTAGRADPRERPASPMAGTLSDRPLRQDSAIAKSAEPALGASSEQALRREAAEPSAAPPPAKPLAAPRPQAKPAPVPAEPRTDALASRAPVWTGFERQPPDKWIERIEELRRNGQEGEAREMLEEFRKRFPDHPLPASLVR